MFQTRFISAMEKCFLDQKPEQFAEVKKLRMYKNERASIQFLAYEDAEGYEICRHHQVHIEGELAPYIKAYVVENVPNYLPANGTPKTVANADPGILRTTPGLYPDVLMPLMRHGCIPVIFQQLRATWIDIDPCGALPAGKYKLTLRLKAANNEYISKNVLEVEILDACLPEQKTHVTRWFYADCLSDYYDVPAWSDRHFEICESFIRTAVKNGHNTILTPVFTPPLDTEVGGERTTVQLVDVRRTNGRYSFGFKKLDRWLDMLDRCGVKYIEISHLFTQWGASHAPKIMATVDGEEKRLFGWDTDASGKEYVTFLRAFLKKLTKHLEARGLKERTYFHLSDEPHEDHLVQYLTNKKNVSDILKGWKILDALSNVEFYRQGACETPAPSIGVIDKFMEEDIAERWVYYCCGPWANVTNQFMSMTMARTRYLGMAMYTYGLEGFLHWGFNFFNSQYSIDFANPYMNQQYWVGGGDSHVVYPAHDGTAYESLRLRAFAQAMDDIRVMQLCESYYGKDKVVKAIEKIAGKITFSRTIDDLSVMQAVRDKMDTMIKKQL